MPEPQPATKLNPNWKVGAAVFLVFLFLLLVMAWIYDATGQAILQAAIARTKAMGRPVTMDELLKARHVLPDDQNGALVILNDVTGLENDQGPHRKLLLECSRGLGRRWSNELDQQVNALLQRDVVRTALAALDKLAQYPRGQFPISRTGLSERIQVRHWRIVDTLVEYKSLQMSYRTMHGDTSRVIDDLRLQATLGQYIADEPFLLPQLVRLSTVEAAVRNLERVLGVCALTEEQLAAAAKLFGNLDGRDLIETGMRAERALLIEGGRTYRQRSLAWPRRYMPGLLGIMCQNQALALDHMNEMVRASSQPDPLSALRAVEKSRKQPIAIPMIPTFGAPALDSVGSSAMRYKAAHACVLAAIAAERYRLAKGEYPQTLDSLVPQFLESVPLDPFTRKPVLIAHQLDRVCIYSVGEDYTDNHGDLKADSGGKQSDWGFVLLKPEYRNQPPVPESRPDK